MVPISAGDRRFTPKGEGTDISEAEDEEDVSETLSARGEVLLQFSFRRAQCWHGERASHFTLLALHCSQPCLVLVWKRREGIAREWRELFPSYQDGTGARALGHTFLIGDLALRLPYPTKTNLEEEGVTSARPG